MGDEEVHAYAVLLQQVFYYMEVVAKQQLGAFASKINSIKLEEQLMYDLSLKLFLND